MDDKKVQEDFEVTKQAMKAYEAKLKGEIGMVTEEDVEKARVDWDKYYVHYFRYCAYNDHP